MKAILALGGLAVAATIIVPVVPASAQCPPGYAVTSHQVIKQGEEELDQWTCNWAGGPTARTALEQLQNMGKGYVDTTTGFDGGQGPSAAVATAPPPVGSPNMSVVTEQDLQKFGKDPAYSEAVSSHHYAAESRKEAEAKTAELRQQQAKTTDSMQKQKIQIEIAKAEQELTYAKGAEKIAGNNVMKEVIRLKPQVLSKTAAKKTK